MTIPEFRLLSDPVVRSNQRKFLNEYLDRLRSDKDYVVQIKPDTRSLRQNNYIWAGVYPTIVEYMREHHGRDYSSDAIHETLKELFLPYRVELMERGEVRIYRTTRELTKGEFCEYIEHISRWAAGFDCQIPEPTWPDWKVRQSEKEIEKHDE